MKIDELLSWLAGIALLLSAAPSAAEDTAVVKGNRINVRGRPALMGEVITQLQKGEKVVILEEVTVSKPSTNEPSKWLRIQMPANTPVWVYAPYVDPASKKVNVSRLNLRGGPGENFSVVGRLERGAAVREIRRVEDWMEIDTPPNAYAFIAANLVEKAGGLASTSASTPRPLPPTTAAIDPSRRPQQPAPIVLPPTPAGQPAAPGRQPVVAQAPAPRQAQPPITATPAIGEWQPVRSSQSSAVAPSEPRPATGTSSLPAAPAGGSQPLPTPPPTAPVAAPALATTPPGTPAVGTQLPSTPPPGTGTEQKPSLPQLSARGAPPVPGATEQAASRRIVRREGLVRSTVSIQAPTYYELLSPANRKTVNYLHTEKLGLDLKDYRGKQIVVTGEEAIDPRWPRTPVIEVETLELIQ